MNNIFDKLVKSKIEKFIMTIKTFQEKYLLMPMGT